MIQKILIVDDDPHISEILSFNLQHEGYEVLTARSGEEALTKLTDDCALILLDIMMVGMSGYTFAQRIRKAGNHVPIIFLTAKNTENDMLTGFSVGGDDYIAKPFSVKEVLARVRAVCRRTQPVSFQSEEESIIVFEPWRIDLDTKEFSIDGQPVKLTKTEFQLLVFLTRHPNKVYPRDTIIDKVWEDSTYITERTVDVHITRLRKKLGKYANRIENRSGFGYRFNPTADEIDA